MAYPAMAGVYRRQGPGKRDNAQDRGACKRRDLKGEKGFIKEKRFQVYKPSGR